MLEKLGKWWVYQDFRIYNKEHDNIRCGFTKKEAESLFPQIKEAHSYSKEHRIHQHFLVDLNGVKFYVLINHLGSITLPIGKDYTPIKTSDRSKIIDFQTKETWLESIAGLDKYFTRSTAKDFSEY